MHDDAKRYAGLGMVAIAGDMALRIEKAFGVKMDTLMRMQSAHDIGPKSTGASMSGAPRSA
jgi:antitoxin HigA-1